MTSLIAQEARRAVDVDNRDLAAIVAYQAERIEAMTRELQILRYANMTLELENARLRQQWPDFACQERNA